MSRSHLANCILTIALIAVLFAWRADHVNQNRPQTVANQAKQSNSIVQFSNVELRLANVEREIEHFQRIESAGGETLTPLLDAIRRHISLTQQKTMDSPTVWQEYLTDQLKSHSQWLAFIKEQFDNGAAVNIQQLAQIQEQIHYIQSLKHAG